jgi:hypothetical protein
MAGKPLSLSAVLQEGLPKAKIPPGISVKNRFAALSARDRSTSSVRGESPAKRIREDGKRGRDESAEKADRNLAFKSMADEEEKFRKAKEIVGKVRLSMAAATGEGLKGPIADVLNGIIEWMDITTGVQEVTANVVVDSFNKAVSPPRKSRKESVRREPSEEEKEEMELASRKKKFVQEVKEAERSSLIFKANLGDVPIMNPDTLKKKFAQDMVAKAAMVENLGESRPSRTVAAQLDDALEMCTRMEFFGKETKKALKKGKSGEEEDFYTMPVRLYFKDKVTRDAADARMRKMCKMGGSIPYHRTLRNVINTVVEEGKAKFPSSYIQVKVDAEKFQLRVSRREDGVWFNNIETVPLPPSVLDLSRAGPTVKQVTKGADKKDTEMEIGEDGEQSQG